MKPMRDWYKYEHDCERCVYLGSGYVEGQQIDWYHCPGSLGGSIVGRYGDDGPEYRSMPVGMLQQASDNGSSFASAALCRLSAKDCEHIRAAIRAARGESNG